jgi:hypothetical protein
MTTNIRNKADEVLAWSQRNKLDGGLPSLARVLRYIEERWPDLNPDIKDDILNAWIAASTTALTGKRP